MTIKMKDVFGLGQGVSFPVSMTDDQCRYCYIAVGAYDANQERIDELTELLQLCVDGMYSQSGRVTKKTAIKLMAACQKKLVEFPK